MSVGRRRTLAYGALAGVAVAGALRGGGADRTDVEPAPPAASVQPVAPRRMAASRPLEAPPGQVAEPPPRTPPSPDERRARHEAALQLLGETALRLEDELAEAERAGDDERAFRLRVRLERLAGARARRAE